MTVWNFEDIMFYAGLAMSGTFVLLASWGLIAFFPRKAMRGNTAPAWLILAIWLGFLGLGMNVFYWRVFGDIATRYGYLTLEDLSYFGRYFGDFIWKGVGCLSIYLHFYARWKSIPYDEQSNWSPLLMGFYPDLSHWAVRMGIRMQALFLLRQTKRQED